jgi:hypothetical protein
VTHTIQKAKVVCQAVAFETRLHKMHIFDSMAVARNSGRDMSLYSSFGPTSTAFKVLKGRKKRSDPRITTEQTFRVYEGLLLTRDEHKAGIDELQARPCALNNPVPDGYETRCYQSATVTQDQMSSSQVCLAPARSTAACQELSEAHPTTTSFMGKATFNLLLGIPKPERESCMRGIQPLTSELEMEIFWPSFTEVADSVRSLLECLSLNTQGETKAARDPRMIDLEPASTRLVLDSSRRCTLEDPSLEESLLYSEQSSTSDSGFDEEDSPYLDEDCEIKELVDDIIWLAYKHWNQSVNSKGLSADTELIQSLTKHIQKYFDRGFQSLAAVTKSAASSTISESNRSDHSSMAITSQGSKRSRTDKSGHEADDDGENDEKSLKRPKQASLSTPEKDYRGFACPYRKHNPRKYCVHDWSTCVLTPLRTVARVK